MLKENIWYKKVEAVLFPPSSFPPHPTPTVTEPAPSNMSLEHIYPYYHQYSKTNLSLPTLYESEECLSTPPVTMLPPPPTPAHAAPPSYYTTPSFASSFSYTSSNSSSDEEDDDTAEHNTNVNHHQSTHNKKETSSSLKRLLQPYKIFYEIEWPGPQHTKWIQLDEQTSKGIERVKKRGFADLQVPLDERLTNYIHSLMHPNETEAAADATEQEDDNIKMKKNILIDILFNYQTKCQDNNNPQENVQLLRLRRVRWWSKDYFIAQSTTTTSL